MTYKEKKIKKHPHMILKSIQDIKFGLPALIFFLSYIYLRIPRQQTHSGKPTKTKFLDSEKPQNV